MLETYADGSALVEIRADQKKMQVREITGKVRRGKSSWSQVRLWTSLLESQHSTKGSQCAFKFQVTRAIGKFSLRSAKMVRRFFTNLQVNLAVGFLLFFFSERLFWTVFKPGDQLQDLVITWLAYSVLGCVFLNLLKRCGARELPRVALAGAVYGWLAEGALVGTLYGTESSAPFPLSVVQTALSWHMLISVVVGWYFLTGAVRHGSLVRTVIISAGVGLFWGAWAPFQWRETPPVIVPIWTFVAHATVTGACLAIACGILSGGAWSRYKPGWFGLGLSILILAVFYSEQVKALGPRPLIVLPLLVGSVLALLCWTKGSREEEADYAASPGRWKCAAAIMLIPLTASVVYALQFFFDARGMNPSWIFHGLALLGGMFFLAACGLIIRKRMARMGSATRPAN